MRYGLIKTDKVFCFGIIQNIFTMLDSVPELRGLNEKDITYFNSREELEEYVGKFSFDEMYEFGAELFVDENHIYFNYRQFE